MRTNKPRLETKIVFNCSLEDRVRWQRLANEAERPLAYWIRQIITKQLNKENSNVE